MINDRLREGNEEADTKKLIENKGSENRLDGASDFNLDSHKNLEKSSIEARETRESGREHSIAHRQEHRLDNAADFKEISENREKRSEIIEGMVSKDFPVSSEKRLDNAKDFHYADQREFEKEFSKRDPSATEENKRLTDGFHDGKDNQAYVRDKGDTLTTSIHEKLHQKSMSELPTRLNEGITEHYAREKAGPIGSLKDIDHRGREISKPVSDYEKEVEIVRKLESTIGREPLNAAYFEGKTEVLQNEVDKYLGEGAFKKISDALENRDYQSASEIIEKYYRK